MSSAAAPPAAATPCACESDNAAWVAPAARPSQCFFFDLGAGDGETFLAFLHKSSKWQFDYNTNPFTKDQCNSYLLEANPKYYFEFAIGIDINKMV